ncbi:MAG TPA: very short patch repair endonuclease [Pirellulales bacterium]|nr:very short patch repair endonuclease [Pirellulales bacterium]
MDTLTHERRSEIMGRVRSKNTRPELAVRRLLHRMGYRFRLHRANLPGKPDIVLSRLDVVVFVNGCFWHRHTGCPSTRMPKSRLAFWREKFASNVRRDRKARRDLRRAGWRVLVVWECQVGNEERLSRRIRSFLEDMA